jgi:lipoprotein-releasing system permease protein
MKRRSFSLLLAWRYLNPRRSMLSSFSIISLIGVMLGVLVLVVVMAVYSGLERDVKTRLLGSTPHVLVSELGANSMVDWQDAAAKLKQLPHVTAASPYVQDNVIVDVEDNQQPIIFRGIDTTDATQVQGIDRQLDRVKFPDSNTDFGLDDRVVISSGLSERYKLRVGDVIRLYSTRNFRQVLSVYKATEKPPIREAFTEPWQKSLTTLKTAWKADGEKFTLSLAAYREAYAPIAEIYEEKFIRDPERELLDKLLAALNNFDQDDAAQLAHYEAATHAEIEQLTAEINQTDAEKMDNGAFKNLKSIVLPKEVSVIGVYQTSQMAVTPDLFAPLHLAQNLAGLGEGVSGIDLRLDDPYQAGAFKEANAKPFTEQYAFVTWGEQYKDFFYLIEQQRGMMYFMLSFIILISAFSMMAVMFTVTIQKRREIGVMKALGAAPGQIVRVFLYQGMILGTFGAILGVLFGRLVIYFRGPLQAVLRGLGFDPFTSSFTGFHILPAHNNPWEQATFALMAFVLCSLAALVPAFFAARSDAAKSLRNL